MEVSRKSTFIIVTIISTLTSLKLHYHIRQCPILANRENIGKYLQIGQQPLMKPIWLLRTKILKLPFNFNTDEK